MEKLRRKKVQALLDQTPWDIVILLEHHNMKKWEKSARKVRRVRKWINRIKRIRRIMDKRGK